MILRHQVFEVTVELGTGLFTWNRFFIGEPTQEKVLELLDLEIEESEAHRLNELGSPTLVDLHKRYRAIVADFGMPEGTQCECMSYDMKVGMIYVVRSNEVVQISTSEV